MTLKPISTPFRYQCPGCGLWLKSAVLYPKGHNPKCGECLDRDADRAERLRELNEDKHLRDYHD